MKKLCAIFSFIVAICVSHGTWAMPCDTGYQCVSKLKKYEIEIQTCRYINDINLISVKVMGRKVEGAKLGAAFDGTYHDKGPLNFEIDLPIIQSENISHHVLSIEIPAGAQSGYVEDIIYKYDPDSPRVMAKEPINCAGAE